MSAIVRRTSRRRYFGGNYEDRWHLGCRSHCFSQASETFIQNWKWIGLVIYSGGDTAVRAWSRAGIRSALVASFGWDGWNAPKQRFWRWWFRRWWFRRFRRRRWCRWRSHRRLVGRRLHVFASVESALATRINILRAAKAQITWALYDQTKKEGCNSWILSRS